MKNNYNIKFKHGINYRGEIDVLNLKLLDDKPKPEIRLKNFDDALDSMNTRTLRQLRNFIAREPFDLYSDETGNVELKKVLQVMLPSLFLRKNQALLKKLKILGFNNEVKNLFVEKRKLDKGIRELMKIMNIDKSIEPAFRVDLYSIINMRLRLKIQEALGFGYFITEERYITNTKDSLEKLQRIRREGKKLSEKGLNPAMKRLVKFINSEAGKSLLDINNEVASQNHDGLYNVRYLGLQLLHNIKLFNKKNAPCFTKIELKNNIPKKYLNSSARNIKNKKNVNFFRKYIKNPDNLNDKNNILAAVITPDKDIIPGSNSYTPAYLVYSNYEKILNWNRSLRFALAVCTLKNKLKNEI